MAGQWQPLNGTTKMTPGGQSKAYPNLRFAAHTDWRHVNPTLLAKLQQVAKLRGVTVDVISGYRDNHYSATNGGFAGDPHSKGIAVDAYINGKAIGDVIPTSVWAAAGIRSGNTFTYHGKTDPEHLDLYGEDYGGQVSDTTDTKTTEGAPPPPDTGDTTDPTQTADADLQIQDSIQNIPQMPGPATSDVALAGSFNDYGAAAPVPASETWRLIASNGNVSPDTLRLAQLAGFNPNAAGSEPPG